MGHPASATPATSASCLATCLQQALARSGLGTQTALARAAGLDPSYTSRLLRGAIPQPTLATLGRLADALRVPLADLASAAGYVVPAAPATPAAPLPPTLDALISVLRTDAAWLADLETIGPAQTALLAALAHAWQAQARAVLTARYHPVTQES